MNLLEAFKAAFDSLVRTYSPIIIGAVLAWVAILMGLPVPEEVTTFVTLLVAVLFQMVWYGTLRIIELVRGKASNLLGLFIVKSEPLYVPSASIPTFATRAERKAYLKRLEQ